MKPQAVKITILVTAVLAIVGLIVVTAAHSVASASSTAPTTQVVAGASGRGGAVTRFTGPVRFSVDGANVMASATLATVPRHIEGLTIDLEIGNRPRDPLTRRTCSAMAIRWADWPPVTCPFDADSAGAYFGITSEVVPGKPLTFRLTAPLAALAAEGLGDRLQISVVATFRDRHGNPVSTTTVSAPRPIVLNPIGVTP